MASVELTSRFTIGDRQVNRLGFGTMQLTGTGVWGPPADPAGAVAVLRRAAELGVDLFDTADSYGPYVAEELLREALHPYDGLTIATKAGFLRTGPSVWVPCGRPEYLRQQCEMSLRRLGVERIDLFQLHRIDPTVPADEQFGLLAALQDEGKIAAVGLSEVSVAEIEQARAIVDVATVQNRYNLIDRASDDVLRHCTEQGIGFMPWFPIASGRLAEPGGPVAESRAAARRHGARGGAGLAVAALVGDAADPGHEERGAPGGEHAGGQAAARPGVGGEARRRGLVARHHRRHDPRSWTTSRRSWPTRWPSGREWDLAGAPVPAALLVQVLTAAPPPGAPALRLRRATVTGALRLVGARVGGARRAARVHVRARPRPADGRVRRAWR